MALGAETYQRGLIGWTAGFLAAEETRHQRNRYSAARSHTEAGPVLLFGEIWRDFWPPGRLIVGSDCTIWTSPRTA